MRAYFKAQENYDGSNWLLADFGCDDEGRKWKLTTDCVHASELHMVSAGADGDAKLVADLLNWYHNTITAPQTINKFKKKLNGGDTP